MSTAQKQIQITKAQHYVPRFYLKQFAKNNGVIQILDAEKLSLLSPRHYSSICYSNFFYGLKTGVGDNVSQVIEAGFGGIEGVIAQELPKIITLFLSDKQIPPSAKMVISDFMSMLWLRGPMMRKQLNHMEEDIYRQINSRSVQLMRDRGIVPKQFKDLEPEELDKIQQQIINQEYSLEFNNASHLNMLKTMPNFGNLFMGMRWEIFLSKGAGEFLTSDNPIVQVAPQRKTFYGPGFMDMTYYFALNPNILIKVLPGLQGAKMAKRKILFKGDERVVQDMNITIARYSYKYAYSGGDQILKDIINKVEQFRQQTSER